MSIQLSTAGVTMKYAVEATSGTRPTTGYTEVPELKAIPEMNPEPDTLETTNLKETEYKTYIAGLKDLGGALGFTINLTKDSLAAWSTMVEAYDEAAGEGKAMWFCIDVPGLAKDLFFTGQPTPAWTSRYGGQQCAGSDGLYYADQCPCLGRKAFRGLIHREKEF